MQKLKKIFADYDEKKNQFPEIVDEVKSRFKKGMALLLVLSLAFAFLFPYLTHRPFSMSCIVFALVVISFSPIMFRRTVLDEIKKCNKQSIAK